MDHWEKFSEKTLSEKEKLYSNLTVRDITDADYMHGKKVCKDLKSKKVKCLL